MSSPEFSFGDRSVASGYDDVLVPVLFEPWARALVTDHGPWAGQAVLDLATGTGIVARLLADEVGSEGRVMAVDINAEMLALAKQRCADARATVEFIESPASPLNVSDESADTVVCQQGFQFFPDKTAAARELRRVLRAAGRVVATTWCGVSECEYFGRICDALGAIDEPEIATMMRAPFDFMPEGELRGSFETAGFRDVRVERQERPLEVEGGVSRALEMAYATPIGPKLRALSDEKRARFQETLTGLLADTGADGHSMGRMVSNVLLARK